VDRRSVGNQHRDVLVRSSPVDTVLGLVHAQLAVGEDGSHSVTTQAHHTSQLTLTVEGQHILPGVDGTALVSYLQLHLVLVVFIGTALQNGGDCIRNRESLEDVK